nr:hypothetical protein [Pedobacter sp. ASV2]
MQTLSILKVRLGTFKVTDEHLSLIWQGNQNGKVHLFKLLDVIITNRYIDSAKNHSLIAELCRYHFDYYDNEKYVDLETLAERNNYTREHLRNIRKQFDLDFYKKFSFLLDIDFIENTDLAGKDSFIFLPDDFIKSVNRENKTSFTRKFITRIYAIFNKQYSYIGDDGNPYWKNGYLIIKELDQNFHQLINEYRIRIRPYPLRHKDEIWRFSEIKSVSPLDKALDVLRELVHYEFPKIGDVTDQGFVLRKSKALNLDDRLEKIFNDLGPERKGYPLKLLIQKVNDDGGKSGKESSIRGTLIAKPQFSAFGKKSTYVLTEWLDDPKLDVIAGDYWRVCQSILEREPYPLDKIALLDKLSYYRTEPKRHSINNMLSTKEKNVFQVKAGYYGLLDNEEHNAFFQQLGVIPSSYFIASLWDSFQSTVEATSYFSAKGLSVTQIDYMIRYMERRINADERGDEKIKPHVLQSTERSLDDLHFLLSEVAELDAAYKRTKARREHLLLKKILFYGKLEMSCAICGRLFPTRLLAVAHIKRRSMATDIERKNPAIVMATCVLGCDALFEKGFISVNADGIIEVGNKRGYSLDLIEYIKRFEGRKCDIYDERNRTFFYDHYAYHQKRNLQIP